MIFAENLSGKLNLPVQDLIDMYNVDSTKPAWRAITESHYAATADESSIFSTRWTLPGAACRLQLYSKSHLSVQPTLPSHCFLSTSAA